MLKKVIDIRTFRVGRINLILTSCHYNNNTHEEGHSRDWPKCYVIKDQSHKEKIKLKKQKTHKEDMSLLFKSLTFSKCKEDSIFFKGHL